MAAHTNSSELIELVRRSGIVRPERLNQFLADHEQRPADAKGIAALLKSSGLITSFQAKLLLSGRYKGFRLGSYVLLELLGKGGMGTVYLAEHEKLNRKAAIKVLPPSNKLAVERFLREARAAAALDHPNIVRTHDVAQEGDIHYLVMEYVDGMTLDKIVNEQGNFSAEKAAEYIAQAAAGLQHAFERGFIHRDIKPSNLMLSKDGIIKILDMGLARSFEKSDQLTEMLDQGAIVGTADYISPEQATNDPSVGIRTDIYSLGATFFAIVTGRPPFNGSTASKLIQHQVKDAPSVSTLDKTFPRGLSSIIAQMLAKKPEDRFQTPAELISALQPWMPNSAQVVAAISSTQAGQSGTLSGMSGKLAMRSNKVSSRRRKRRGWLPWTVAGVLLAAAIAGGYFFFVDHKKPIASNRPTTSDEPIVTTPTKTTPTTQPTIVTPPADSALFTVDAAKLPLFTVIKERQRIVEGANPELPTGLELQTDKTDMEAAFSRTTHLGKPALKLVNRNEPTAQMVIDLEKFSGKPLRPDQTYIFTVEYATEGEGHGLLNVNVHHTNVKTSGAALEPATKQYKTKTIVFTRRPGKPLQATLDSLGSTPANALYIARVWVNEDSSEQSIDPGVREIFRDNLERNSPVKTTFTTMAPMKTKEFGTPIGNGHLRDWTGESTEERTNVEVEISNFDDALAIGIRTSLAGDKRGNAILTSSRFECPTGICRVQFEYKSESSSDCILRYRAIDTNNPSENVTKLAATANWQKVDVLVNLNKSHLGHWEFVNTGRTDESLWIRKLVITEMR